jgi:hypothetical protein
MSFSDELKPDDPDRVKPYVAQGYKWISRIGVFESSAFVLIGERETRTATFGDYFVAFNYDLKNGEKTLLTPFNNGFVKWKFNRLIRFDSSGTPDIVFSYFSCTECEAERHLGSLRLDPSDAKWKLRIWTGGIKEIIIGRDFSVGTDEDSADKCLYKFSDFNGDGFDDLAVRCLTITDEGKILEDETRIYTVQQGQSQALPITDLRQLDTVRAELCVDAPKSKLCPKSPSSR